MDPFDINAATLEMKSLDAEIKRVHTTLKELKKRKEFISEKIKMYLNRGSHTGIIINDMTILSVTKPKTKALTKKEKEEKIKGVLRQYNLEPERVSNELSTAVKGKQTMVQQLVIKKE